MTEGRDSFHEYFHSLNYISMVADFYCLSFGYIMKNNVIPQPNTISVRVLECLRACVREKERERAIEREREREGGDRQIKER